ncbi:hypothetical protein [Flagellimonas beolgyonensis]|uniref:hypothetical protein n=1 Tax=Flagellimonas beolgyonensis TaxID=864064 RepID=UPI0013DEF162|nr:hypothetical protein [Allomuricauda beolgyonensis]
MKKTHENAYAAYLLSDDLLHIVYKKGHTIDLKAAQVICPRPYDAPEWQGNVRAL